MLIILPVNLIELLNLMNLPGSIRKLARLDLAIPDLMNIKNMT
jgi:hypothetical protein